MLSSCKTVASSPSSRKHGNNLESRKENHILQYEFGRKERNISDKNYTKYVQKLILEADFNCQLRFQKIRLDHTEKNRGQDSYYFPHLNVFSLDYSPSHAYESNGLAECLIQER